MKIDLLGGSYAQRFGEFNSQRTINWYPVITTNQEKSKSSTALFPTAGLSLFSTLAGTYFKGLYTVRTPAYPQRCFAVVNNILYEVNTDGTNTARATLTDLTADASRVYMTTTATNFLGIFHPSASYAYNLATNTAAKITSVQFVGTVSYADYLDGFTIVVSNGSVFYATTNDIVTGWLSTNTWTPTFKTSPVIAAACLKEEIYNFTSTSCEIYINDGTPFERLARSTVSIGLAAKNSLAGCNDGFYFLGRTPLGETGIYFLDNSYACKNIAPSSIAWALNNSTTVVDAAYGQIVNTKDGHQFYYLTIPQLNTTYVYDTTTNEFHERQSQNPSTGLQNVFRGFCYTNFNGMNLFGDLYSGKIFQEKYNYVFEDTNIPIIRTRISETFNQEYCNIGVNSLELDCNAGSGSVLDPLVNPTIKIYTSGDGGQTFGTARLVSLGIQGNTTFRSRLFQLGTKRNWTIKLELSDPVNLEINNAVAKGITAAS